MSLGALPLPEVLRIAGGVLAAVLVVVLALFVVDFALFLASPLFPLDPVVWGTYAAWAGAVLPTLGVGVAAATWIAGRHQEAVQAAEDAALQVTLERKGCAVASLQNDSAWPVMIVSCTPTSPKLVVGLVARPGGPRVLFDEQTERVKIRIRGSDFILGTDGTLVRAGQG